MTLRQPNIDRLLQLGLSGMAEALEEQRDIADVDQLGFDDRLAMMIEREAEHRNHKSYLGHLRQAQLRIRADVQDVDCRAGRGIARTTLTQLAAGDWIRQGHNLILGGPTGSGKTFVACALAHQACRQHQSVLYRRVPELVAALTRARDKGTLERLMGSPGQGLPAGPRRLGAAGLLHRGPARPVGDRGGAPRTQVHPRRQSDSPWSAGQR